MEAHQAAADAANANACAAVAEQQQQTLNLQAQQPEPHAQPRMLTEEDILRSMGFAAPAPSDRRAAPSPAGAAGALASAAVGPQTAGLLDRLALASTAASAAAVPAAAESQPALNPLLAALTPLVSQPASATPRALPVGALREEDLLQRMRQQQQAEAAAPPPSPPPPPAPPPPPPPPPVVAALAVPDVAPSRPMPKMLTEEDVLKRMMAADGAAAARAAAAASAPPAVPDMLAPPMLQQDQHPPANHTQPLLLPQQAHGHHGNHAHHGQHARPAVRPPPGFPAVPQPAGAGAGQSPPQLSAPPGFGLLPMGPHQPHPHAHHHGHNHHHRHDHQHHHPQHAPPSHMGHPMAPAPGHGPILPLPPPGFGGPPPPPGFFGGPPGPMIPPPGFGPPPPMGFGPPPPPGFGPPPPPGFGPMAGFPHAPFPGAVPPGALPLGPPPRHLQPHMPSSPFAGHAPHMPPPPHCPPPPDASNRQYAGAAAVLRSAATEPAMPQLPSGMLQHGPQDAAPTRGAAMGHAASINYPSIDKKAVTWTLEELERQLEVMAAQVADASSGGEGPAVGPEARGEGASAGGHAPHQAASGAAGRPGQGHQAGAAVGENDEGAGEDAFYDAFSAGRKKAVEPAPAPVDGRRVALDATTAAYVRTILPRNAAKYWMQRYSLFSRFDANPESPIQLDTEGWWSVTPEVLAAHQAERGKQLSAGRSTVAMDACCGCGGNVIQMAMRCHHVIGVEISPKRIEMARHNAALYDVAHKCDFICADYFSVAKDLKVDVLFMSPPWGGPKYQHVNTFDIFYPLVGFNTPLVDLLDTTMDTVKGQGGVVAAFLPRNTDLPQLAAVVPDGAVWEVERAYVNHKLKGITLYCHPGQGGRPNVAVPEHLQHLLAAGRSHGMSKAHERDSRDSSSSGGGAPKPGHHVGASKADGHEAALAAVTAALAALP